MTKSERAELARKIRDAIAAEFTCPTHGKSGFHVRVELVEIVVGEPGEAQLMPSISIKPCCRRLKDLMNAALEPS